MEVVEEEEGSEVCLWLEAAGVDVVGAVVVMDVVRVVAVVVMVGVLELVENNAGGGDTGALQQTDAVDDGSAEHLPEEGPSLLVLTVLLHPCAAMECWLYL